MEKKIINFHTWKIIMTCKGFSNVYDKKSLGNISNKEVLSQYLKEYLCIEYMDDSILYIHLLKAIFEVFDSEKIYDIYKREIPHAMYTNRIFPKKHVRQFLDFVDYSDFCNIFLDKLLQLQLREIVDYQTHDLYLIKEDDGNILTLDEASMKWIIKDESSVEHTKNYNYK